MLEMLVFGSAVFLLVEERRSMAKPPFVCRPVTEYLCCECQRRGLPTLHREGFDERFDDHVVFQSRHSYATRNPTPNEVLARLGKGEGRE